MTRASSTRATINRVAQGRHHRPAAARPRYCPADPVTRGQMATFLSRALALAGSRAPITSPTTTGRAHEDAINRIAEAGITAGCSATRFCPTGIVSRQQMAAFLYPRPRA